MQVSNQNEQAKYKRMQDSLQVKLEQVKQQQAELDRQLMQAEQSQKDAVEIADALILKAMEGGQVKRERWEQLFLDNALVSMKKENPKEYNQLIEMGRKIATSEMHKRQRKQEQNRRTTLNIHGTDSAALCNNQMSPGRLIRKPRATLSGSPLASLWGRSDAL